MKAPFFSHDLTRYNRYILDKIISRFETGRDFNIYVLVEEAVLYKCILPSQNEVVMDTYYAIKEYLIISGFVIEQKEMSSYILTNKGTDLKLCGMLRKYEQRNTRKNIFSVFQAFLKNAKPKATIYNDLSAEYYE